MIDTSKMIFVFGSNLSGIHGAGAARYAHKHRNYPWKERLGLFGTAYGIPTKNYDVRNTLPLQSIQMYIKHFIIEANDTHKDKEFQVTCIGCGLAGLRHEDIAPMFKDAPDNCYFDTLWQPYLGDKKQYWGTF